MEQEDSLKLNLGSIDFTPDWAKKDAGVTLSAGKGGFPRGGEDGRPEAKGRSGGERKPFVKKPFDRARTFERKNRFEERPRPLDAEVKILPETKALGTIIRKLQQDTHAYKLKDLAYFFLDNPQSVLLKVSPRRRDDGSVSFAPCQCKACSFASTNEDEVVAHILSAHLGDYYEVREIEVEPPKGNFSCVARCSLSGVLLGPPNVHEFNSAVKEMVRTRFPEMSEERYRSHIEMVRDSDTIEQWRQSATKKTVYFAKGAEGEARALTREQAEGEFRRTILPSLVDHPKNLMITADMAMLSPCRPLQWAARDALERERRAPYNMCFALRGAFHHRKLKFFRANDARGPEFVTSVEYREFDTAHAIAELAAVAAFVGEHPCCDRNEILREPTLAAFGDDLGKQLDWLVSTGHVVAFTNGVFSKVEKFPKYGPQWRKRAKSAPAAEAVAEPVAEAEVKPVAEAVAENPAEPAEETVQPSVEAASTTESVAEAPVTEELKAEEEVKKDEAADQLAE
jgi:hypothetical protein